MAARKPAPPPPTSTTSWEEISSIVAGSSNNTTPLMEVASERVNDGGVRRTFLGDCSTWNIKGRLSFSDLRPFVQVYYGRGGRLAGIERDVIGRMANRNPRVV